MASYDALHYDPPAPIAQVIATATGRRVRTVLVPAYNDLRAGLLTQEFDVAFVHPAHVSMAEIKAGRYKAGSIAWGADWAACADQRMGNRTCWNPACRIVSK